MRAERAARKGSRYSILVSAAIFTLISSWGKGDVGKLSLIAESVSVQHWDLKQRRK